MGHLRPVIVALADAWPLAVDPDDDVRRSLAFLDADVDPETLQAAGNAVGTVVAAIGLAILSVAILPFSTGLGSLLVATGAAVAIAGRSGPPFLARLRRTQALGAAPALLTRATLRMRITPVPERAARFAARTGDGPLARSLDGHVERTAAGPGTGLDSFADEWGEWFPALDRACTLLESAGAVPSERRPAMLDRTRAAVLDGARERAARFGTAIRGPSTALYAFGVLLPLALVALFPALRAAGVPAPLALIALAYDVVLPLSLVGATAWLLVRRPVAFPPPAIDRDHPDVPETVWPAVATGCVAAIGAWVLTPRILPGWTAPIAAIGFGVGTGLVVAYHPMVAVRERVREVEAGLPDALALLGRRVASGQAAERAIAATAEELSGPIGEVLGEAAHRQERLGEDVERAFLGPDGALADLPSRRTHTAARTLATAAREGAPAGETIVAAGSHLDELAAVERETRRSLDEVTGTLSNTAAVFGPLVGGATVALAAAMGGSGPLASIEGIGGLGLAVGIYVLVLSVVLTTLATGLSRGLDRSLVGYRVGLALLAATATYLTAFAGAGLAV